MKLFFRRAPPDPRLDLILATVTAHAGTTAAISRLLATLNTKVTSLMATIADVQAALATEATREQTIIGLLTTEATNLKDVQAQLAAAIAAGNDPAAVQIALDMVNANITNMDAAIASVTPPAPAAPAA